MKSAAARSALIVSPPTALRVRVTRLRSRHRLFTELALHTHARARHTHTLQARSAHVGLAHDAAVAAAVQQNTLVGKYVFNVFGLGHCIHVFECI